MGGGRRKIDNAILKFCVDVTTSHVIWRNVSYIAVRRVLAAFLHNMRQCFVIMRVLSPHTHTKLCVYGIFELSELTRRLGSKGVDGQAHRIFNSIRDKDHGTMSRRVKKNPTAAGRDVIS